MSQPSGTGRGPSLPGYWLLPTPLETTDAQLCGPLPLLPSLCEAAARGVRAHVREQAGDPVSPCTCGTHATMLAVRQDEEDPSIGTGRCRSRRRRLYKRRLTQHSPQHPFSPFTSIPISWPASCLGARIDATHSRPGADDCSTYLPTASAHLRLKPPATRDRSLCFTAMLTSSLHPTRSLPFTCHSLPVHFPSIKCIRQPRL